MANEMQERPILFQDRLVRAILENRKTQTRRLVRFPKWSLDANGQSPYNGPHACTDSPTGFSYGTKAAHDRGNCRIRGKTDLAMVCPYGGPGDRLYVREAWRPCGVPDYHGKRIHFRADDGEPKCGSAWRPSIHLPHSGSRIWLEVVEVRVERLRDITEEGAKAEGVTEAAGGWHGAHGTHHATTRDAFASLWDSINAKRPRGAWNDNPWVWAISFKRVS